MHRLHIKFLNTARINFDLDRSWLVCVLYFSPVEQFFVQFYSNVFVFVLYVLFFCWFYLYLFHCYYLALSKSLSFDSAIPATPVLDTRMAQDKLNVKNKKKPPTREGRRQMMDENSNENFEPPKQVCFAFV